MNNEIQVFNFNDHDIRIVDVNENQWWVLKDVCDVLGLSNPTEAAKSLDDDEKSTLRISEGGPEVNIITESGLYSLVIRSNKPDAKKFKRWVTHEVLPSIRKHGMYSAPQTIEQQMAVGLIAAQKLLEQKEAVIVEQSQKIEADKPKVNFANAVEASPDSIGVFVFAKLIQQNGVEIGGKRLFEWFRLNGYLLTRPWNMPAQRYVEQGLFEIKENIIDLGGGRTKLTFTPKITGKGQTYFVNKFLNKCEQKEKGCLV
jgi:Prophage antirepressor